jgi:hypothetical protein
MCIREYDLSKSTLFSFHSFFLRLKLQSNVFLLFSVPVSSFGSTGVWTQGLAPVRQGSTTWFYLFFR